MPRSHICLCLFWGGGLTVIPPAFTFFKKNNKPKYFYCVYFTVQHVHTVFFVFFLDNLLKPKIHLHVRRMSVIFVACRNCKIPNVERNKRVQFDLNWFAGSAGVHPRKRHVPEASVAMAAAVFHLISWHLLMITISHAEDQSWRISPAVRGKLRSGKTNMQRSHAKTIVSVLFLFFPPHAAVVQLFISALCLTPSSPLLTCCFLSFVPFWFTICWHWHKVTQVRSRISRSCLVEIKVFFKSQWLYLFGNVWSVSQRSRRSFVLLLITTVSRCQLLIFDLVLKCITKLDLLVTWLKWRLLRDPAFIWNHSIVCFSSFVILSSG